jgi:DNA mismatch repair protein MutL
VVEVRHLFFNTPVRRKFLKSPATELRHTVEAVTRIALARPDAAFQLTHGRRPVLRLPAVDGPLPRIRPLFSDQVADALLPVNEETPAMSVTGYAGAPSLAENSSRLQYVLLNGRYIRDRAVQRAVMEAYRGRMLTRAFPVVFLYLWMDPSRVDVNVHPTKIEVRFRDPGAVYTLVLAGLERALAQASPTPGAAPSTGPAPERHERVERAMEDFFLRRPSPVARPAGAAPAALDAAPPPSATPVHNVIQVCGAYLIEETADGFRVIDQHALHERLLYTELAARSREATVSRQRLLIPEVVELRPAEFLLVMEVRDYLARLGMEVAEFGENTAAVHTVPHLMRDVNAGRLLRDLIEDLQREGDGKAEASREERLLLAMACRGAVKAGKRMSQAEIEALLDRRDRSGAGNTCPHGRPHTLDFRLDDLERQFHRR